MRLQRISKRPRATIADKVAFLAQAGAYPEGTKGVGVKETHMSWVFLTDRHAYKLKKPVKYGLLDYGTIAARRRNCRREVRLNRRLAPDVYLGTVALTLDRRGGLRLGGSGRVVDWLVKMRRLPARRTLEDAIAAHTLRPEDIDAVAARLSAFYRDAPRIAVIPEGYCCALEAQIRESHRQLSRPEFGLDGELLDALAGAQLDYLQRRRDLFARRARSGRIVEGHGDLRPEHIYLCDAPIIIDCLEFERRLRTVDPASELAYLAMECDRFGAPAVESRLFEIYRRETGDDPPGPLIAAYKCFHAHLRARIAVLHLDDPAIRQRRKWMNRTVRYLGLAQKYARDLSPRREAGSRVLRG